MTPLGAHGRITQERPRLRLVRLCDEPLPLPDQRTVARWRALAVCCAIVGLAMAAWLVCP